MSNFSNYVQTFLAYASTRASTAVDQFSTGSAIALSTYYGWPYGASTNGGFDISGYDGVICVAGAQNTTGLFIQPLIHSSTNTLTTMVTSSGWAAGISTGNVGYSTTYMAIAFDLYKPVAKFVGFSISIPGGSSGAPLAAYAIAYNDRSYPVSLTDARRSTALVSGSTIFISPSTA